MENFENENNLSDEEIMNKHFTQLEYDGSKKYIVNINNSYVPLVDSMSIEERNELINDILAIHNDNIENQKHIQKMLKSAAIIVLTILFLIFIAPCTLWLVNKSFTMTKNNYNEMQNNFEVLYKQQNR